MGKEGRSEGSGMSAGRKALIAVIAVLLLLAAAAYGFGVYYFSEHFLPGSYVNGFNCSYMDQAEAEDLLKQKTAAYVLAIRTRGNGQESIAADEIGLAYTSDGNVKELMLEQDRFLWFLAFGQQKSYEVPSSVIYDETKFEQKFDSLKCLQDNVEPVDAYIQDDGNEFVIVPEVEGTLVNRQELKETIIRALTTGDPTVDLEEDGCYVNPKVYGDDERLNLDCQQMNELTDVVITYDFSDRKEQADRDVIREWLSRDENGDLALDKEKVAAYVAQLAKKYDTVGTERTFETYDNREVKVSGGDYGWVIDQAKETDALYDAVMKKETQVREPEYSQKAQSRAVNDIGYTYIEVNMTGQRLVVYKDGNPVADTSVYVPGGVTPGVYLAGKKESPASPAILGGGSVNYWIPYGEKSGILDVPGLTSENIVLMGESWDGSGMADFSSGTGDGTVASSAGGTSVFSSGGSEFCVQLPEDQAASVYQNADAGMPVVVYQ